MRKHEYTTAGNQSSQLPESNKASLPSCSGAQQDAAQVSQGCQLQSGGYYSSLLNSTDILRNPQFWEDVLPSTSQPPRCEDKLPTRITREQLGTWTQVPLGNGTRIRDSTQAGNIAVRASNLKISAFHHRLLLNGKLALDPYTLAVYNQTPQEPQNGFSISYGPNSNVYNSMEKIAGAVARDATSIRLAPVTPNKYNGAQDGISLEEKRPAHSNGGGSFPMSLKGGELPPSNACVSWFSSQLESQQHEQYRGQHVIDFGNPTSAPLAPVTPDKCKQLPDIPQPEIIDLVEDSETEENGIEVVNTNQTAKGQSLTILSDGTSVQEDLPSCGTIQQPTQKLNLTCTELESRGIDLNKTPQQKPRKKKHRPKVIREGASARKGKQAAPKPAGTIETPPPKRKYTRRKESSATETPSSGGGESNNPTNKKARKSAKRALHFQSEEIREEARNSSYEMLSPKNHGSQDHFDGTRITNGCSQGPHVVDTNLCRVSSDFDHSVKQVSNNRIASKETSLQAILASRRAHLRENLNNLALLRNNINNTCNSQSSLPTRLLPSHEFSLNSQTISNGCSNSQFIGDGVDFRGLPRIYSCGNNDISTNYRNLIMENPQMKKICSDIYNTKDKWLQSNGTEDNCGRGEGLQRNITDNIYLMLNKPRKENGGSDLASTGPSFLSSSCRNGEKLNVPQRPPVLNHESNSNFNDRERKQPPKAPTQVCNFSSLIGGISCGQLPSMSKVPHLQSQKVSVNTEEFLQTARPIKSTGMKENNRQCNQINVNPVNPELPCSIRKDNPIHHRALSQKSHQQKTVEEKSPIIIHFDRNDQRSLHVRAKAKELAPDRDLLEIIIHKLKYLCISDGVLAVASQEPQSALVPYNGNGTIVPYESPIDLSKKRKPRAKVDLDNETNRVWLLLMGKEGDLGAEGKDLGKEKYWEEERRVFRGRVDSFIARMHLVQGDRRFSPWKGSVVDSVVGVFLTQNVSDHLSSSAFMCMAAKYPVPYREFYEETETKDFVKIEDDAGAHQDMLNQPEATECPGSFDQPKNFEETKSLKSGIFLERSADIGQSSCKSGSRDCLQKDGQLGVTSVENSMHTSFSLTGSSLLTEDDETRTHDFAPSSQSVISSQNSSDSPIPTGDRAAIITDLNYEIDDPLAKSRWNNPYPSFMEMLQMVGSGNFEELAYCQGGRVASRHNIDSEGRVEVSENRGLYIMPSSLDRLHNLNDNYPCTDERAFQFQPETNDYSVVSDILSSQFRTQPNSTNEIVGDIGSMPSFALDITSTNHDRTLPKTSNNNSVQNTTGAGCQRQVVESSSTSYISGLQKRDFSEPSASVSNSNTLPNSLRNQIHECETSNQQIDAQAPQRKETATVVKDQLPNYANSEHFVPLTCCDAKLPSMSPNGQGMSEKATNLASKNSGNNNSEAPRESKKQGSKTRKGRVEKEKKVIDWDSLRRANISSTTKKEKSRDRADSVDWDAVRRADVSEISNTIRERGMNNMLSERIKDFLDRLVREHGSIDLEWLRDVPPDQAKDYLLSIRGLGLKSVECVRLLTLHHLAFPVDTNVGRICVRLGWVPLQPLPESLQLHLLEMYPLLETIQKYLWPRLCKLDQKTLYELHYQMITFGKVFCTKSKPNCNACPMRGECKHFASAFASARLPLPGPEEKGLVSTEIPIASEPISKPVIVPMPVAQLEGLPMSRSSVTNNCEPIIEEPGTPEPEYLESLETDIEDAFYEDPDEIPVIKLNIEQFTQNLQNIMQGNMELLEGDMSKALVALTPEAASIPLPKLKNVNRLRTEHLVYELPDSHPLLEGWERREPDDPCPYLLAIWTPGETAQSTGPPDITCSSRENGDLCDKKTCFACNSIREAQSQKVRGTLLIPCRTAMRGSFPLNGTYFQVNELFADHFSSINPIEVPREWIWNLPRRTVYFGTSVPSIFKGLGTDPIQMCFWKGYICVRGFDRKTRFPRPLLARLHLPISKAMQNKRMPSKEDE